jgi:hypothetical protein
MSRGSRARRKGNVSLISRMVVDGNWGWGRICVGQDNLSASYREWLRVGPDDATATAPVRDRC